MTDVTRAVWWNVPPWLETLLYIGTAVGLLVSALALARYARVALRARPVGSGSAFRLAPAVGRVVADILSHRRLLEDRGAGLAHALLFYGFLGLFIGTCLVFVHDKVVGSPADHDGTVLRTVNRLQDRYARPAAVKFDRQPVAMVRQPARQ